MRDIIDIKPPVALPRDLRPWIIGAAAGAALLLAGLAAWLYVRRRKPEAVLPPKPAHVLALEQLEQLEREGLVERGDVHAQYVRLTDIFRQYLQNRFAIPAVEQTTQELLRALQTLAGLPACAQSRTRDFLLRADLVKFAKYRPAMDDAAMSLQQVRDVIEQTRQDLQTPLQTEATGNAAF